MESAKPICTQWFATRQVQHDLYCITEAHYWWWNRANLWLIKGRDRDLLIDTGLGVASLRQSIANLIDKPLLAIASHIHYDHAGGLHEFEHRAIHAHEAAALAEGDNHAALCDHGVLEEHFEQLPYAGFRVDQYTMKPTQPTQVLQAGDLIDLGNRAFEVLHLPGHSPGCIALYDPRSRELFSGDVVYDGDLLDELYGSDIPTYISTYERLQHLKVEAVHPGHYPSFGQERLNEILAEYLAFRRKPGCPSECSQGTAF